MSASLGNHHGRPLGTSLAAFFSLHVTGLFRLFLRTVRKFPPLPNSPSRVLPVQCASKGNMVRLGCKFFEKHVIDGEFLLDSILSGQRVSHQLSDVFMLRPEIGYFHSYDAKAFDLGTKNYMWQAGLDMIVRF